MTQKPRLRFWQIWNMSFGFFGIQFGFALQNANVSRIFETLGANVDNIPILWIAAPVTGLIVQPIIGYWSDKTWCWLGRRRPFFFLGAILASIALLAMPNSSVLWVAAGTLWIMDTSINISMEPFRAFVGDMLPSNQRTIGFAMQSFFIGVGAVVASLLPYMIANWFGISNTASEGVIPNSVKFSFYTGGVVFLLAVLWSVIRTKEYPPEELRKFDTHKEDVCEGNTAETKGAVSKSVRTGLIALIIGSTLAIFFYYVHVDKEVFVLPLGLMIFGFFELSSALLQQNNKPSGFTSILNDLNSMPLTMKQLAIVQFFSWFALFAMWIYTTSGVTADKYDMKIDKYGVAYLEQKLEKLSSAGAVDQTKKADLRKELTRYKEKLANREQVSTNVNLVKFFLNNKIYNEKELAQKLKIALKNYNGSNPQSSVKLIAKIDKQIKCKRPDLSYATLNTILQMDTQHEIEIPEEIQIDLPFYIRLKEIRKEYNDGADWVGVGFAVYNGFAAVFAFFLMFLARITTRRVVHQISLIVGGLSYLTLFWIQDTGVLLLVPFIGIGLAWASILSIPYAILTGSLPQNKMGIYMGIFNFFIVIPQILAASLLGFMVKFWFDGEAIYALILGGASLFISGALIMFVKDDDS